MWRKTQGLPEIFLACVWSWWVSSGIDEGRGCQCWGEGLRHPILRRAKSTRMVGDKQLSQGHPGPLRGRSGNEDLSYWLWDTGSSIKPRSLGSLFCKRGTAILVWQTREMTRRVNIHVSASHTDWPPINVWQSFYYQALTPWSPQLYSTPITATLSANAALHSRQARYELQAQNSPLGRTRDEFTHLENGLFLKMTLYKLFHFHSIEAPQAAWEGQACSLFTWVSLRCRTCLLRHTLMNSCCSQKHIVAHCLSHQKKNTF